MRALLSQYNLTYAGEISFISCGEHSLRQRMDFSLRFDEVSQNHVFGFYDQHKNLLDIHSCLQVTPELQRIFAEFRTFHFYAGAEPLRKGSVRLRTGNENQKGVWLDFANADIKKLLDDGQFLKALLQAGFAVEIGQKGKLLIEADSGLRLGPSADQSWFSTCGLNGEILPLNGLISDFTQPSRETAHALVQTVLKWLQAAAQSSAAGNTKIIEFGPGLGQFTLPFLSSGYEVTALEIHVRAADQLQKNAEKIGLSHRLQVFTGDYHQQPSPALFTQPHVAFVNPARSGLKSFTGELLRLSPEYIIYVSCFPESMAQDLQILSPEYRIIDVKIVDQFPQTTHFESLTLMKKIT